MTDVIISEIDVQINRAKKDDRMSPPEYAQDFWTKVLWCGTLYSEEKMEGIIMEGLNGPTCQIVRGYWSKIYEADLQDLARRVKFMANHRGDQPEILANTDKNHRGRK